MWDLFLSPVQQASVRVVVALEGMKWGLFFGGGSWNFVPAVVAVSVNNYWRGISWWFHFGKFWCLLGFSRKLMSARNRNRNRKCWIICRGLVCFPACLSWGNNHWSPDGSLCVFFFLVIFRLCRFCLFFCFSFFAFFPHISPFGAFTPSFQPIGTFYSP